MAHLPQEILDAIFKDGYEKGTADMLVKIRDYIYYECSYDDSVTKVFEYLEQLKEQDNE